MQKNIAVIPGDGIGPEVTAQAVRVLNAVAQQFGHEFTYENCLMGADAIDKTGDPLPQDTIDVCLKSDAILFGAIGHPKYDNDPTAKVRPEQGLLRIRKVLELFANIRPVTSYTSLYHLSPLKAEALEHVDFVIFRELTGGIYFGKKELNAAGDVAIDECSYSTEEINLWRKNVQAMASKYPEVEVDYMFVDNAAMQLILNPKQFDVILTENMFGDIISDEGSVLTGSLGLLPSASVGNGRALFEPIHGSYPQAAGKDIANPLGSILSAALMLEYFDLHKEAQAVKNAVNWTLENGFVTKDIDATNFYFTSTIGELVADHILHKTPEGVVNKANIELRKSTII